MRRSVLTQTDMDHHHDEQDEDSDEERSPEEKPLKTGFLNNIKQRFQRRFTGVRSRCRSRMQKSPSQPQGALSTYNGEGAEDGQSPDRNLNNPGEDESNELQSQSISVHLIQLSKYGWYWGPITREQAEEKLSKQPDGSFLVRDSSNDNFLLSVSFRCSGRTFHTRIFHNGGKFSLYAVPEPYAFNSIPELVEHSISSSQSTVFCYSRPRSPGYPSFPVRLVKPVSRSTQVRSLQYLCRFVIRQYTRVDQIKNLPLPSSICGYIEEGQF